MIRDSLRCAYCGQQKHSRDAFPSSIYAQCWLCFWKEHQHDHHAPPWWRRLSLRWPVSLARVEDMNNAPHT